MSIATSRNRFWVRLVAFSVIASLLTGDVARAGPELFHFAPQSIFRQEESLLDQAARIIKARVMNWFWPIARTAACVFLFGTVGAFFAQKLGWAMGPSAKDLVPGSAIPSSHVLVINKEGVAKSPPGFSVRREVRPPLPSWEHEALDRGVKQMQSLTSLVQVQSSQSASSSSRGDWLNRSEF